ncbi:pachytene checkpoint protein 2 homolog isoform X2 [Contarinia nasturtii]|uniref:pachytene checkpoint protein 2 homolog isoform X2 n=1 Tax=Contarinia nasturtii TaxID=265458 RepID=UPI0012D3F37B|nr:pachytene checkpoint protein 2 homolog isoform X2 [Contarinia nasturtii]
MDNISSGNSIEMDYAIIDAQNDTQSLGVYVEILRRKDAQIDENELYRLVFDYLKERKINQTLVKCENAPISDLVEEITINQPFWFQNAKFEDVQFFAYTVNSHAAEMETIETADGDMEDIPASQHWILPNREFQGLWEFLYFEDDLKENLLRFSKSLMLFAEKKVDTNAISCNKLILLHGPPGTGKTSLSKALAHKISIHMSSKFRYTHLFEINSHSLFSKWFSESGKLVMKMFTTIKDVCHDAESLVVILIDEVESIAYARDTVSIQQEPSDSLRVVNAVLTQLDQLRNHSNVLVLTTSNLSGTIDIAFVDRADLKQFIGFPSIPAIFHIFKSAIDELVKVQIVINETEDKKWGSANIERLLDIAKKSQGLSGRSLRKLPLLAHAWFIHSEKVDLLTFLVALDGAVEKHLTDISAISK